MPVVEFTDTFLMRGGQLNRGDRALLSDYEAEQALRARVAVLVEDAKAILEPPAHKQIRRAAIAK